MRRVSFALAAAFCLLASAAIGGEAEIKAAQDAKDRQKKSLNRKYQVAAYSIAAPNIKRIFPTVETFMDMVTGGYGPVHRPRNYAFGKVQEMSATSIVQQVLIVGPDGKDYEAIYTLELQPDGTYRITSVSLRASKSLST
jgi:hypothetical protein